jgi:urease accessory protein
LSVGEVLLLLADGRWPGGGYAHSGGLEPMVASGAVGDAATLRELCAGRLTTTGLTDAWLAAGAQRAVTAAGSLAGAADPLARLDDECEARLPVPALRLAGRRLGRGLLRSATVVWPVLAGCTARQHPVVLGAVTAVAGGDGRDAARLALHGVLTAPISAAPKLFAIDMADAMAVAVALAPLVDDLVEEAVAAAAAVTTVDPGLDPPFLSAPCSELAAHDHSTWEVRLFAS